MTAFVLREAPLLFFGKQQLFVLPNNFMTHKVLILDSVLGYMDQ